MPGWNARALDVATSKRCSRSRDLIRGQPIGALPGRMSPRPALRGGSVRDVIGYLQTFIHPESLDPDLSEPRDRPIYRVSLPINAAACEEKTCFFIFRLWIMLFPSHFVACTANKITRQLTLVTRKQLIDCPLRRRRWSGIKFPENCRKLSRILILK